MHIDSREAIRNVAAQRVPDNPGGDTIVYMLKLNVNIAELLLRKFILNKYTVPKDVKRNREMREEEVVLEKVA